MTLKLNGTNSEAAPAYAGDDADTGLQCGTNELKLVTGGSARATVDSSGRLLVGATSGAGKFIVQDSSLPKIQANYADSSHLEFGVGGSGCGFAMTSGHFMTVNHQPYADRGTDNNFTERLRIDSTGNIGVGGATPNAFSNYTTVTLGGSTATTGSGIDLENSSGEILGRFFADSNGIQIATTQTNDAIRFETAGGLEKARILAGGGLTFNGDLAQANALSDYEEGTWTPSLGCTGQSGSFTLPVRQGFYTKIGRVVHLQFRITWSAKPGTGGHLYLEGFPFAYPATTGQGEFGAGVAFKSGLNSNSYVSMLGSATGGGSRTAVKFWDDAGAAINVTTGNNIASSGDVRGSLTYMV